MNAGRQNTMFRGWVLYDGRCRMCRANARRFGGTLRRRGFSMQPLQRAWARRKLQLPEHELLSQMRVLRTDGTTSGGADAIVWLANFIWWAKPLQWFAILPGGLTVLRRLYRAVASRRTCTNGACIRAGVEST